MADTNNPETIIPEQQPQPVQKEQEAELTRAERRKLKREQSKEERKKEKSQDSKKSLLNNAVYVLIGLVIIIVIAFFVLSANSNAKSIESFGRCMAEKGVVVYGNEWCQYTARQKSMFGGSFGAVKYVICDENKALCDEKKITITPTWEINGTMYKQVQKLETLSQLSGCPIKS